MDPFLASAGSQDFQTTTTTTTQDYSSYQQPQNQPPSNTELQQQHCKRGVEVVPQHQHQQMVELCSPVISSTCHPELKNPAMVQMRGNYPIRSQENNIGSLITMLIDDQGADLDDLLTENRERNSEVRETRHEGHLQNDIKEENCGSEQLSPMEYPRPFPSPEYAYYQRDYVGQESHDKDIESRSSLSSNSEGDDEIGRCYSRSTFDPILSSQTANTNLAPSPFIISRDTGQTHHGGGGGDSNNCSRKDEKYWERRRKNNLAAKKSRDARRVRENQLRLRVLCLENANRVLREQMDRKEIELSQLRERLGKYETPPPVSQQHQMGNI